MYFNISEDMKIVRELLNITQEELADELHVEPLTIKRIENGITNTSKRTLDLFYDFIYKKKIYLNKIKEMFYKEGATHCKSMVLLIRQLLCEVSPLFLLI